MVREKTSARSHQGQRGQTKSISNKSQVRIQINPLMHIGTSETPYKVWNNMKDRRGAILKGSERLMMDLKMSRYNSFMKQKMHLNAQRIFRKASIDPKIQEACERIQNDMRFIDTELSKLNPKFRGKTTEVCGSSRNSISSKKSKNSKNNSKT